MRDSRTRKLILEVPEISIEFFGEMLRDHIVWFFDDRHRGRRRINEELIEAAIERHRRAQARRTKSNRRYERNLVATKRRTAGTSSMMRGRARDLPNETAKQTR
jgi:hypothetical protein